MTPEQQQRRQQEQRDQLACRRDARIVWLAAFCHAVPRYCEKDFETLLHNHADGGDKESSVHPSDHTASTGCSSCTEVTEPPVVAADADENDAAEGDGDNGGDVNGSDEDVSFCLLEEVPTDEDDDDDDDDMFHSCDEIDDLFALLGSENSLSLLSADVQNKEEKEEEMVKGDDCYDPSTSRLPKGFDKDGTLVGSSKASPAPAATTIPKGQETARDPRAKPSAQSPRPAPPEGSKTGRQNRGVCLTLTPPPTPGSPMRVDKKVASKASQRLRKKLMRQCPRLDSSSSSLDFYHGEQQQGASSTSHNMDSSSDLSSARMTETTASSTATSQREQPIKNLPGSWHGRQMYAPGVFADIPAPKSILKTKRSGRSTSDGVCNSRDARSTDGVCNSRDARSTCASSSAARSLSITSPVQQSRRQSVSILTSPVQSSRRRRQPVVHPQSTVDFVFSDAGAAKAMTTSPSRRSRGKLTKDQINDRRILERLRATPF